MTTQFKKFTFSGGDSMENSLNEWLTKNPTITIISHNHTRIGDSYDAIDIITIFYTYGR